MSDTAEKSPLTGKSQLTITDVAADRLKSFLEKEGKGPEFGLRLGVQGGGCSGFSYFMDFDTEKEGDNAFSHKEIKVFVDPKSITYINGATLDYADGLHGAGFSIKNPNQSGGCGCGQSFSV